MRSREVERYEHDHCVVRQTECVTAERGRGWRDDSKRWRHDADPTRQQLLQCRGGETAWRPDFMHEGDAKSPFRRDLRQLPSPIANNGAAPYKIPLQI